MSGPYDKALKRLVDDNQEDYARWAMQFLEGQQVQVVGKRSTEFTRTSVADAILDVIMDGEQLLLHFEFQARNEKNVPVRTMVYHGQAILEYHLPVYSIVIYLKEDGQPPASPMRLSCFGKPTIQFDYAIIDLSEMTADDLRQLGLSGVSALMILTQDGATREVAEEIITTLEVSGRGNTLLTAYLLITLVFDKKSQEDQQWLQRRWNIMSDELRDTWVYQEILKEGREEGLREGLEKGREEERKRLEKEREEEHRRLEKEREEERKRLEKERKQELERLRQMLLGFVQARFASQKMERLTKNQASIINDPRILQELIFKVGLAHTAEEVQDYLENWPESYKEPA